MRVFAVILTALFCIETAAARAAELAAPQLKFVFGVAINLGPAIAVQTVNGRRKLLQIIGGEIEGPGMRGTILSGGWDWQTLRSDGCVEIAADYFVKTEDGVTIKVKDTGFACQPVDG